MKNMEDKLSVILNEIQNINKKLDELQINQCVLDKKLDSLIKRDNNLYNDIECIRLSTNNMDQHISFVENVYDTIKSPFYFILNKISKIESIPEKKLLNF